MTDHDPLLWHDFDLTEDPAIRALLDEMAARNGDIEAVRAAFLRLAEDLWTALAVPIGAIVDALRQLLGPSEVLVVTFASVQAEIDAELASRRRAAASRTLPNRAAERRPPRDLRATEAPRRRPTQHRRFR